MTYEDVPEGGGWETGEPKRYPIFQMPGVQEAVYLPLAYAALPGEEGTGAYQSGVVGIGRSGWELIVRGCTIRYWWGCSWEWGSWMNLYAWMQREGVCWFWVALDPENKIIPALRLGSRKTEGPMESW